jgi:hypothetical protein
MDQDKFDDITKALAGDSDRRSVIKRLAGGLLGGVLAVGAAGADARKRRHRPRCGTEGVQCRTKSCCQGFVCDTAVTSPTYGRCIVKAVSPPPPPICRPTGEKCNPKVKNSCGDPNACECVGIVDPNQAINNPHPTFAYRCRPIEFCRATYNSCLVGASQASHQACCNGNDYCKPIDRKNGFCKPKPTCPAQLKWINATCGGKWDGYPCQQSATDHKGCVCKYDRGGQTWTCVFDDKAPKGGVTSPPPPRPPSRH